MAKTGRPTKYRPEYVEQAYKFCLLGATDEKLATMFDVCVDTIAEWKRVHPEFQDALRRGKAIADAEVANSLFHRATGYTHPDVHVSNYQGEITLTPITKHYPPDPTSMIFWLKNRQRKDWRDKTETEQSGKVSAIILGDSE